MRTDPGRRAAPFAPAQLGACRRYAALLALLAPLGACGVDRALVSSAPPEDYRVRHPIILAEAPVSVEIFAAGGKLDRPARDRVEALARESRGQSTGAIEVLFPQGAANDAHQRAALPGIRNALATGGAKGYISVGAYPATDPSVAAPIRVSYRALRARVASTCGEWPADLASGSSAETWTNKPYHNMGCAYQNMIAAQISDPRDLVEPRAVGDGDVEMRIRAIGKVRQGADPGTQWQVKNSSIGSVGGG